MPSNISDVSVQDQLINYRYNPAAILRVAFQTLADVNTGVIPVVDPSNPLVAAMTFTAFAASAAMSRNDTLNRFQYAALAQNLDQLYRHMSDTDYINRFAIPSQATVELLIPYQELLGKLIADPVNNDRRIVIPANTVFTVAGTPFSLQYPIIIRQQPQGALQVLYDTSNPSPLQTLSSNVIPWTPKNNNGVIYLSIDVLATQFAITSVSQAISASTLFQYRIAYPDQFYYCRVYTQNADKSWTEIQTTHDDLVYDIRTVTAVLSLQDGNVLQVGIPQIYTASGQLQTTVRIDIYTTQGQISLPLGDYEADQWTIQFQSVDKNDPLTYTAPLSSFTSQIYAISRDTLNGGSNGQDFATLLRKVINHSTGPQQKPISRINLTEALLDLGYSVTTDIDNLTNRLFLATRALPDPVNSNLITAAGTTEATVSFTFNDIVGRSYVIDHSTENVDAITITPQALYQDNAGIVSFVSDAQIAALNALIPDQKALQITNGNYLYSPFHYVLDVVDNSLGVRAYYLDSPLASDVVFQSQNPLTQLQVGTASASLTRTTTGYLLTVVTQSSAAYQALDDAQVQVQLAVLPEGESTRAYLNGVLAGKTQAGERVFTFDLSSSLYVDGSNNLSVSKMFLFTTDPRNTFVPLNGQFDLLWSTSSPQPAGWKPDDSDQLLGHFLLPLQVFGITHEMINLEFGTALSRLWTRSRSVVTSQVYQTWTTNVPSYYPADVYKVDPVTGSIVTIDPTTHEASYTILHHKGDPVLDAQGAPVYAHKIGDIMLDPATGQPIVAQTRNLAHQVDFMLVEGVYQFATDPSATAYRQQMIDTIVTWLDTDLETLASTLLENSQLFFYPKKTLGQAQVLFGNGLTTYVEMGQSLKLTIYMDQTSFNNVALRNQLSTAAVTTISSQLDNRQVSRSGIEEAIRNLDDTILDAELTGLGAGNDFDIFTLLDDSIRPSLRKRLVSQSDNSLIVSEDLTIAFLVHDPVTLT